MFDPFQYLSRDLLRVYERRGMRYHLKSDYLLEEISLGLTLWSGEFEGSSYNHWLRWCDLSGNIFLTGDEKFQAESQRAEAESQRAEAESQRAEAEKPGQSFGATFKGTRNESRYSLTLEGFGEL